MNNNSLVIEACTYMGNAVKPCACQVVKGRSYCEEHLWLVYKQGSNLTTRKKDIKVANDVRLWESLFNEAVEELVDEGFL
jgi:hypothetical protein